MLSFPVRMTFAIVLLMAILLASPAVSSSLAQTPEGDGCVLDPVTLPLFDATPAAAIAATPIEAVNIEQDDEAIRSAVAVIVDCLNSGDATDRYAIFTDRYLSEQFADPTQTYQPEFEYQLSIGASDPEGTIDLVDVTEITWRVDGSVSVVVELTTGTTTYTDTLILVDVDGAWLIDSIENLDPPR